MIVCIFSFASGSGLKCSNESNLIFAERGSWFFVRAPSSSFSTFILHVPVPVYASLTDADDTGLRVRVGASSIRDEVIIII